VKRALKNGLMPPKQHGRYNALPEGSEADILAWIQYQAQRTRIKGSSRTFTLFIREEETYDSMLDP
jgi:hypothetical protein